jgi:hypothetical protein
MALLEKSVSERKTALSGFTADSAADLLIGDLGLDEFWVDILDRVYDQGETEVVHEVL